MPYPETQGYTFCGRFSLPFRLISKSNYKPKGAYHLPAKYRKFENDVCLLAKTAITNRGHKEGWITIFPGSPTKTHIDPNNAFKSIFDALVKAEIFTDDKHLAGAVFPFKIGHKTYIEVWVRNPDGDTPN